MKIFAMTLLMVCAMCPVAFAQEVGPGELQVGDAIPIITTGVVVGVTAVTAGVVTTTGGSLGSTTNLTSGGESASLRRAKILRHYVETNRTQVEQHASLGAGDAIQDLAAILEIAPEHHRALARHLRNTRATLLSLSDVKKSVQYVESTLQALRLS